MGFEYSEKIYGNSQQPIFTLSFDNPYLSNDYIDGNIKIINLQNKSNRCLLFCSGNGLYYPNTLEEYINKIRIENKYEWDNTAKNKIIQKTVSKIIFIRDIFKQWYVTGINSKINNIEKLSEYLRQETRGYEVTIIGNSAGGYIGVLIGLLIKAKIIITVSGQFNLWDFVDKNPLLKKYKNELQHSKYYNIMKLMEEETNILYFVPINCETDIPQYELVKKYQQVKIVKFNSNRHGLGEIHSMNYPILLRYDKIRIDMLYQKYKDKEINPYLFFIERRVFFLQFIHIFRKIISRIKNKRIKIYKSKTHFA
jgi:hypothetical protein